MRIEPKAMDDAGNYQSPNRIQASLNTACLIPLATIRGPFPFSAGLATTGSSDAMKQL
jgi:hypothetical protein